MKRLCTTDTSLPLQPLDECCGKFSERTGGILNIWLWRFSTDITVLSLKASTGNDLMFHLLWKNKRNKHTHQLEKAELLSLFLSSSLSCCCSLSSFSASLCFLDFSPSRWSCSCFHFSNTFNHQQSTGFVSHLCTNLCTIASIVTHSNWDVYLLSRLAFFLLLLSSSLLFSNHIFPFFGFCFETFCLPFLPSFIRRDGIFLFSLLFLFVDIMMVSSFRAWLMIAVFTDDILWITLFSFSFRSSSFFFCCIFSLDFSFFSLSHSCEEQGRGLLMKNITWTLWCPLLT